VWGEPASQEHEHMKNVQRGIEEYLEQLNKHWFLFTQAELLSGSTGFNKWQCYNDNQTVISFPLKKSFCFLYWIVRKEHSSLALQISFF
jgi:hypothetical protein